MWSTDTRLGPDATYKPNHFVSWCHAQTSSEISLASATTTNTTMPTTTMPTPTTTLTSSFTMSRIPATHQSSADDSSTENVKTAVSVAGLPDDDWLTTDRVVQLLQQPPPDIRQQTAPTGHNDNSYCVVNNITNTERHQRGQCRQYNDVYGAWNSSGGWLCSFPYIVSNAGLRHVSAWQRVLQWT